MMPFPAYQERPLADRVPYHADQESQRHRLSPLYHSVHPVPFSSFSLPVAYLPLFVFKPFWLIAERGEKRVNM
jgi:hypothetical protein